MANTTNVNVRIDSAALAALERIGKAATPKPLNRSEMLNVAVKSYVAQHGPKTKPAGR